MSKRCAPSRWPRSLRTPVVVLYDQAIAQLTETVDLPASDATPCCRAAMGRGGPREAYQPYAAGDDGVPADGAARRRLPHPHHRAHAMPKTDFRRRHPAIVEPQPGAPAGEAAERTATPSSRSAAAHCRGCGGAGRGDRHQRPRRARAPWRAVRARGMRGRAVPPHHAVAVPGATPCARPRPRARGARAGTERRAVEPRSRAHAAAANGVAGLHRVNGEPITTGRNRGASAKRSSRTRRHRRASWPARPGEKRAEP